MNRLSMSAAVLGLAICTGAAPIAAQGVMGRPMHFGISSGATIPTHYLADYYSGYNARTSGNVGAFFSVALSRTPFSVRLDGQWQRLPAGSASLATKYRIIDGTADLVYTFAAASRTSFYVIGGSGVYGERVSDEQSGFDASVTHFGFNGGLGVNFRLGHFATFVESRYHYVVHGSRIGSPGCAHLTFGIPQSCPSDSRPSLQFVPVSAGVAF